jgi:Domain of unknown function (DUF4214)
MFVRTRLKRRAVPALAAAAAALACAALGLMVLAGAAEGGTGTGWAIAAVEGLPFAGTVAGYTSSTTSDQRFVAQAHRDLLDRAPASADLATFADALGKGGTRTQVAAALLASDEYRVALTQSFYTSYLRRTASAPESAAGLGLLKAGATDEDLRSLVLGSGEYLTTQGGGTVHGFLNALYHDVLGRAIDPAAESAFTTALSTGKTRVEVALTVLTSNEARQKVVAALYERLLHRAAAAGEVQTGTSLLANGGTDEDIAAQLVGSSEYFAMVPASFASASIVWGDGTVGSAGEVAPGLVTGSHTFADEGAYPVTVVVTDLDGTTAIPALATVADAPLTAKANSFTTAKKATFTETVATFTDANPAGKASEFTASIVWGDGRTSSGTVTALTGGGFAVVSNHRYDAKGSYAVAVHIADEGGSTANAASTATVTNK